MGYRTCKYRKNENGEIEDRIFDSDEIPDGWSDSPADLKNGSEPVMENPPEAMPEVPEHTHGLTDVSAPMMGKKKRRKRGN